LLLSLRRFLTADGFAALVTWVRPAAPSACPALAGVGDGAGIPVAARRGVVRVDAARGRVATVGGAHVPVVAVGRRAPDARPAAARVDRGGGLAVAARAGGVRVDAARGRVAAVGGADVPVVSV